jgi:hypothetical protein
MGILFFLMRVRKNKEMGFYVFLFGFGWCWVLDIERGGTMMPLTTAALANWSWVRF